MVTMPGVFTPTEALLAVRCNASALKFFPASVLGPSGIAAQLAVLPKDVVVGAVGGVSDKNLAPYVAAGIRAFGLGSSLYRPGMTAAEVRDRAVASVRAYDEAQRACAAVSSRRSAATASRPAVRRRPAGRACGSFRDRRLPASPSWSARTSSGRPPGRC